jgi:putative component of toxin-antitoxin plasmid stabilization module
MSASGLATESTKDGEKAVILLAGGAKKRQDIDITNAKERWQDYKQRKKSEK